MLRGAAAEDEGDAWTAAGAVVTAAVANTLVKCGMILSLGSAALRRSIAVVTVLAVLAAVLPLLLSR